MQKAIRPIFPLYSYNCSIKDCWHSKNTVAKVHNFCDIAKEKQTIFALSHLQG